MARIVWLGHATVLCEIAGARVLTDPVLRSRVAHLRRHVPVPELPAPLDAVLVSHLHYDHADVPTLRRIHAVVPVIGPHGLRRALAATAGLDDVREVHVGQRVDVGVEGVTITAVPARHDGRRRPLSAHADALGFVIAADGTRIYFPGDTDLFDGMKRIGADRLDVALLPVWGWGPSLGPGHLDPERAARAAALLRPRVVIPIHWGTLLPVTSTGRAAHRRLLSEPPLEFARHCARLAPDVEVRILQPGGATEVEA
jgi:L-ascorbate metabolism protein UlaG (beta-lactamase superfamily)